MRLLDAASAGQLDLSHRVGFSRRGVLVGAGVLVVYGAAIAFLWRGARLPAPVLGVNVALWSFFAWFWQRHLRRLLGGHRLFALGTNARTLVFPIASLDRTVPAALDLYVSLAPEELLGATFVDVRTLLVYRFNNQKRSANHRTPVLRLRLREPVSAELRRVVETARAGQGVQGLHVHVAGDDVLEVFFHASQAAAVCDAVAACHGLSAPREVVESWDLRADVTAPGFEAALQRLESAGHGLDASSARRFAAEAVGRA